MHRIYSIMVNGGSNFFIQMIDSIGICNDNFCRDQILPTQVLGKLCRILTLVLTDLDTGTMPKHYSECLKNPILQCAWDYLQGLCYYKSAVVNYIC